MTSQFVLPRQTRLSNFKFGKELGQGAFSTVHAVTEVSTGEEFAIKVVDKQHIKRNRAVDSVLMEKEVLRRVVHPFIIRLHYTFQDDTRLFYVLDLAQGGCLLDHLARLTCFSIECTRFYTAEIFSAISFLHDHSVIHRDLKPENILLTTNHHIKLADFGSALIVNDATVKAPCFTGTVQYVSPEMVTLMQSESGKKSDKNLAYLMDYWAFGCVLYQLLAGRSPFRHDPFSHDYVLFKKILSLSFSFVEGFDSDARDLVAKLLVLLPADRIGSPTNGDSSAIRNHIFFADIDWDSLAESKPPVFGPNILSVKPFIDTSNPPECEQFTLIDISLESGLVSDEERERLYQIQRDNPFHKFACGRLILKQSIVYKRCGLFAERLMLILTEGPKLYFIDTESMELKGDIKFTSVLTVELYNTYLFYIRLPNYTYYMEDPTERAERWVSQLTEVKHIYFPPKSTKL